MGGGEWSLTTASFGGIDTDAAADVDLSFDAANYCDADGKSDAGIFTVSLLSDAVFTSAADHGAVISGDGKTVTLNLSADAPFTWKTIHLVMGNAGNDTQVTFAAESGRLLLDNVSAVRCSPGTAVATEIARRGESFDFGLDLDGTASGVEGDYTFRVRFEEAWTVVSDSQWMTVRSVADSEGRGILSEIAPDGLSASAPGSGVDYAGSVISLSTNPDAPRTGTLSLVIGGETVQTIAVSQTQALPAEGDIAKWTFTGLYYKTFSGVAPDPSTAGYVLSKSWVENHYADSDIVTGGRLSACTKNSGATYTYTGTNRPANSLRIGLASKGDYFIFTVPLVYVEAGSTISFRNAGLAVTSAAASPVDWVEEYSFDGEAWTQLKEFHFTAGHYSIGREDASHSLDCDITVPETVMRGTLQLRVRVTSNATATGTFTDGAGDIAYIYSDPFIANTNANTKTATYTGERDYLVFSVTKP